MKRYGIVPNSRKTTRILPYEIGRLLDRYGSLSLTQIGRGGGGIRGLFYELFSLFSSFEVVFAASETGLSRM